MSPDNIELVLAVDKNGEFVLINEATGEQVYNEVEAVMLPQPKMNIKRGKYVPIAAHVTLRCQVVNHLAQGIKAVEELAAGLKEDAALRTISPPSDDPTFPVFPPKESEE